MILWPHYPMLLIDRSIVAIGRIRCKQSAFLWAQQMHNMAALRVSRKSFTRRYTDRTRALSKLVANLPNRASPDEIHDLRVAIRRIQMMRRLMPGSLKVSEDSKRFDFALRSVMKATSQLRDMDTLVETLESQVRSVPAELLVSLENQRSDAAARAKVATEVLKEALAPELDASALRGKRLSKRLRKRVRRRSKGASSMLAAVLEDESKAVELHSLRKEVKKMRYLIELAEKPPSRLPSLEKWQESLGAIRDLDVAIAYLEGAFGESGQRAILELQRARHLNYLKFVRSYTTGRMLAQRARRSPPMGALDLANLNPDEE